MCEIRHTLAFAYPIGSPKPSMEEIAIFVKSLEANVGDMIATYRVAEEKAIFVKFESEAGMKYTLTHNPELLKFKYSNGKVVEVRMSVAGSNLQYVRVYDLPPEVPNESISLVLGKYGKVKRVIREKFPLELGLDMLTGVIGVYMDVEQDIPSSLIILNRKGNIFYSGNKGKCFKCKAEGHQMNACPNRKIRKEHEQPHREEKNQDDKGKQNNGISYADVVAEVTSMENNNQESEEVKELEKNKNGMEADYSNDEQMSENEVGKHRIRNLQQNKEEEEQRIQERRKLRARTKLITNSPPRKKNL